MATTNDEDDDIADETIDDEDDIQDPFLQAVAKIDDVPRLPRIEKRLGELLAHRYVLHKSLGTGGQGAVYDAEDNLTGERVAVKLLRTVDAADVLRLRREISILRLLSLPGVVRLLDEGVEQKRPFLVTEFIPGVPFPGIPVPCAYAELEPVLMLLLDTLSRIHAQGIVHRDLKPDNVLVGPDKQPVLLDFGYSFRVGAAVDKITDTGKIVGTFAYMAPEQMGEQRATVRTDLYALGIMAHYALTGRIPHERRDMCSFIIARAKERSPSLLDLAPNVPRDVAMVLDSLLATNPADRPRSAAEVAYRLRRLKTTKRPETMAPPPPETPLSELQLRDLFSGPDRLLHLREDAARVLFARTGGDPSRVTRELESWVRAGLGNWDGVKFAVRRDALDEIETRMAVVPTGDVAFDLPLLSPDQWNMIGWVALASPHATVDLIARAMRVDAATLRKNLDDMVEAGVLRQLSDDSYELVLLPDVNDLWSAETRRRVHRALATELPLGAPGRLLHMLNGIDDLDLRGACELAREVVIAARQLAAQGHTTRATLLLVEGVRALRLAKDVHPDERFQLFATWAEIAVAENSPIAIDTVLYELSRPEHDAPDLVHLASLLRAALASCSWSDGALAEANAVLPFANPMLERLRQGVRVMAASRATLAIEEEISRDVMAWADQVQDPIAQARAANWHGRLRYRQGRYDEAAKYHALAAQGEQSPVARNWARIYEATALLDGFRWEEARQAANDALQWAQASRHAVVEGRAEAILRSIAYRSGTLDSGPMDTKLVEASAWLGAGDVDARVCLIEACVAMRMGDRQTARTLAERAYRNGQTLHERAGGILCTALLISLGGTISQRAIVNAAAMCVVPGIGLQALALLALAHVPIPCDEATVQSLASQVAKERWADRMEVFSVNESLEILARARIRS